MTLSNPPAIIVLGPSALPMARTLQAGLPGAKLYGRKGRVAGADVEFEDSIICLRALFAAGTPIIGLCAAGILVRALAPLLADKRAEPPVVAVAEDGGAAVPLLGGHHGANALARSIALLTGGIAAITTAGDVSLGLALDEPPQGWHVANPEAARAITAALLAGDKVRLVVEAGNADWIKASGAHFAEDGELAVRVTDRAEPGSASELVLHPPVLALGVGCERDTEPFELIELVHRTLAERGLSPLSVACVASIDLKSDERAVHALAEDLGVPARFFAAARLEQEAPRLATPSDIVFQETGCHGVAEGAALAAGGARSRLAVTKVKSRRATCAVSSSPIVLDPMSIGQARGRLFVVGIGPGSSDWRSPEATAMVAAATDVVGYGLYLDLLGDLIAGKTRHESALGSEEQRVRRALDLAGEGRSVALVSSGDIGIYAMATLVFELMDRENRPEWNRLDINVTPGISAMQAAAARHGAPLGHDFCTISLSDLLTPWEDIERRLKAAAEGDFVVSLYNPVSLRRRDQIEAARRILLTGRPKDTPVILARSLGRPEEALEIITLGELSADKADMLTLVMIGSSNTRVTERGGRRWVYTPRGYARKMEALAP